MKTGRLSSTGSWIGTDCSASVGETPGSSSGAVQPHNVSDPAKNTVPGKNDRRIIVGKSIWAHAIQSTEYCSWGGGDPIMSKPLARVVLMLVALVVASCGAVPESGETTAQGEVSLEIAELVGQMRDMAWAEQVDEAQALLEGQREFQDTESPAWLVAAWLPVSY